MAAADGYPSDFEVSLLRIVIDEGHWKVPAAGIAQHGGDDLLATFSGTYHHHALGRRTLGP